MTSTAHLTSATADLNMIYEKLANHVRHAHPQNMVAIDYIEANTTCETCQCLSDELDLASQRVEQLLAQIEERTNREQKGRGVDPPPR